MPDAARSYRRRYNHRHPTARHARDGCLDRSQRNCQGCGRQEATEAHHWTYPPEEKTTADHLTGLCRNCHDLVTWYVWFVSLGGSRELLGELFPVFLTQLLDRRDRPAPRRLRRVLRVRHAWGAVVSGESRPRAGEVVDVPSPVRARAGRRRRPPRIVAGPDPLAARPRRGAADQRHRPRSAA